jgi:gas vesicle protein GvpA/GvpJ/GvpM family
LIVPRPKAVADLVLDTPDTTVVDLLDHLLNKGVMATGDVTLGVAGIDLIYLRLSALLCAADRLLPEAQHRLNAPSSTRVRPRQSAARKRQAASAERRRGRRRR